MNGPIHILIVEDDTVDRLACRRALTQYIGYHFKLSEADSANAALEMMKSEEFDFILLDYHLPDLSGIDFLHELRREHGHVPIPVIMLTGADSTAIAVEAMKLGARDYLVKDTERRYLELLPSIIASLFREQQLADEKRQAENKLHETETKYRTLIEQIPAVTYITALDECDSMLYISPQAEKILGHSPDEWLADPGLHHKLLHPDDRMRVLEAFAESRSGDKPLRVEYRLYNRFRQALWVRNEAVVVRDKTGKPLYRHGIMIDVTEAKEAEVELRAHRHYLEELVASRTAMLEAANRQLRHEIGRHEGAVE